MAMAVRSCHFGMTTHGRSWGHTVAGAFAYGCGEKVYCPVRDTVQDYTRRRGVEWWTLDAPHETPMLSSLSALAAGTEAAETRKNAWIMRMISASLYHELSRKGMIIVGQRFAEWLSENLKTTVCVALHGPTHGDHRNWHLHFYIATRELRPDGTYGRKIRELAVKGPASKLVKRMRKAFERIQNGVLAEEGFNVRVSLGRSPDSDPQPKLGRQCAARERGAVERAGRSTRGMGIAQVIEANGPVTRIGSDLVAHGRRRRRRRERNIDLAHIDQSPVTHPHAAPTPHTPTASVALDVVAATTPRAPAIEHIVVPATTVESVAATTPHTPVIGHTPTTLSALDLVAALTPRAPAIEHIAVPATTVESVAATTPHTPVIGHTPTTLSALDLVAAPTPRAPAIEHIAVPAITVERVVAPTPRTPAIGHTPAASVALDVAAAPTPRTPATDDGPAASVPVDLATTATPRGTSVENIPAASQSESANEQGRFLFCCGWCLRGAWHGTGVRRERG